MGVGLEPLSALCEELRCGPQVDGGGDRADMPHERRQPVEPAGGIDALPIPTQQAPHRERVAQRVQPWGGDAGGDREVELHGESMEHLAWRHRVNAPGAVEAEQRIPAGTCSAATPHDVAGQQFTDARPVRDEAALAELAARTTMSLTFGVDIVDAKPTRLPGSQTEAVAESEDAVMDCSRPMPRGL